MPRILIVDDNESNRALLFDILKSIGIPAEDIEQAANGDDAQCKIMGDHPRPFNLVITDLNMPVMNGAALTDWIGRARCKLPVILMSADSFVNAAFRLPTTFVFLDRGSGPRRFIRFVSALLELPRP